MDKQELLIAEYKSLRDEIKTNSQLTGQVFTFAITVSAALLGYGLDKGYWGIFLSPFVVLIPSLYFISSQLESTTRISAYIQNYIESKIDDLNWETDFLTLRKSNLLPSKRKYTLSIAGLYGGIGFISILLSWLFLKCYSAKNVAIISAVSIFIIIFMTKGILTLRSAFKIDFCIKYDEAWKKLIAKKK